MFLYVKWYLLHCWTKNINTLGILNVEKRPTSELCCHTQFKRRFCARHSSHLNCLCVCVFCSLMLWLLLIRCTTSHLLCSTTDTWHSLCATHLSLTKEDVLLLLLFLNHIQLYHDLFSYMSAKRTSFSPMLGVGLLWYWTFRVNHQ